MSINNFNEEGGAGDWGTDKARARLQKDTPGQEVSKRKKMKTFKDVLEGIDEVMTLADIRKKKEREEKRKKDDETRSQRMNRKVYGNMMGRLKDDFEIDEALSDADKKKRLEMIKKAVEKINKNNVDRAKADALKQMKASGMFDEAMSQFHSLRGVDVKMGGKRVEVRPQGTSTNAKFHLFINGQNKGSYDSEKKAMQKAASIVTGVNLEEGPYQKYADLLIKKADLRAKGKDTSQVDKELEKEFKILTSKK